MKFAEPLMLRMYLLLNIFFYASGGLLLFVNPAAAEGVWFFPDTLAARGVWMAAEVVASLAQGWALFSKRGRLPFLVAHASVIGISLSFACFVTIYPLLSHGTSDIARTILWLWVAGVHTLAFIQFWYSAYRERELLSQLQNVVRYAQDSLLRK